ncbi:hypothetical protein [Amycolatopsis sp. 195334CR]|uniref:hypothetical protein n=1 Tax=Amycolatopsis sp. 195334CR TaxID=2814588 RepID=UPI001A90B762|nr:hypothetical protein [Amycolatopsis sp. 195334CR]MBN6037832.1 hypothetical protein [Amycolatopsis sp. 195334CR]
MNGELWIRGSFGTGATARVTMAGCRTVLVVIPTMTAGTRLFDLVPLLEADHRVQLVFTVPRATDVWHGVDEYVRAQGGLVVPWHQAIQHTWDLVLCASHRHLAELRGRILLVSHGAGTMKSVQFSRKADGATRPSTGLDRELLSFRGRLLPAALALATDAELDALRELCPEAVPRAWVAGDICWDRMTASLPMRPLYRRALGIDPEDRLVTVSSTWTADSAFGKVPGLCRRLLDERPSRRVRVAAVLHPNVWAVHGTRQVRGWLSAALRHGLLLIPPEEGWRATMVASDWVIGDHGSTTLYAAAAGCPVSMATRQPDTIRPGSPADTLRRRTPVLDPDRPLLPQVTAARAGQPRLRRAVTEVVTSRPGGAAESLRTRMYRLLDLTEPDGRAAACPVPDPTPLAA